MSFAICSRSVALCWHEAVPLGRNAGPLGQRTKYKLFVMRNAIPPQRGTDMSAWGTALVITHEIGMFEMDLRYEDVGNC